MLYHPELQAISEIASVSVVWINKKMNIFEFWADIVGKSPEPDFSHYMVISQKQEQNREFEICSWKAFDESDLLVEKVKLLQIFVLRQWDDWYMVSETENMYLSFFDKWTLLSNKPSFEDSLAFRSHPSISAAIKWCRFLFRMVSYCRLTVDHLLKRWKSLTPKSI